MVKWIELLDSDEHIADSLYFKNGEKYTIHKVISDGFIINNDETLGIRFDDKSIDWTRTGLAKIVKLWNDGKLKLLHFANSTLPKSEISMDDLKIVNSELCWSRNSSVLLNIDIDKTLEEYMKSVSVLAKPENKVDFEDKLSSFELLEWNKDIFMQEAEETLNIDSKEYNRKQITEMLIKDNDDKLKDVKKENSKSLRETWEENRKTQQPGNIVTVTDGNFAALDSTYVTEAGVEVYIGYDDETETMEICQEFRKGYHVCVKNIKLNFGVDYIRDELKDYGLQLNLVTTIREINSIRQAREFMVENEIIYRKNIDKFGITEFSYGITKINWITKEELEQKYNVKFNIK